jgi:hypothetical protein
MKHSFRLLQELLALDVRAAIGAAYARWGGELGELGSLEYTGGVDGDGDGRRHRHDGEDGEERGSDE